MELIEIYELESQICQATQEGNEARAQQTSQELFVKMQQDPRTAFPFAKVQFDVWQTQISVDVISAVFRSDADVLSEEIDGKEGQYRNFVEDLLDVDLSNVNISRTKNNRKHAEGSALSCRATDHMIFLPPIGADFVSPDLLVHELGHTAEFTLRRASNDIEMIRSHKIFSEAIAHYCQYKYLLEHGNKAQRVGAIGSVTKDHLLLCALIATGTLPGNQQFFHINPILNHSALAEYREVYTEHSIRYLLGDYEGKPVNGLYFILAEARMGAILALHLIHNVTVVRQLATTKTDTTAREMLNRLNLNADELLNFAKADELIRKFIDATI